MIDRRQFLAASATCVAATLANARAATPDAATSPADKQPAPLPQGFALTLQPGRVFKRSSDRNRLQQEQWLFLLVLVAPEARKPLLESLVVRHAARGETRRVDTHGGADLAALDLLPQVSATPVDGGYRVAAFQVAGSMAKALAIDSARCELVWRDVAGQRHEARLVVPLQVYAQRTVLQFPLRGRGMITQGHAWNDGHRNRSGMFAIDAIGLTEGYAMMLGAGDAPEAVAGWGRPLLAPAAGEVVVVRNDRPDQPVTGVSDPKYFVPEHPNGGDPGNHCVIDHGNGEFSLLAHFRQGSLLVRQGDRVVAGQALGQLGNSGDSNTPHLHHQLQTGPQWTTADALPHVYVDGPEDRHDRGEIFTA